jgi:peptidoglycan hydrolase-like protein with peptidoglycan-binding domain
VVSALIGHLVSVHAAGVRPATPQELIDTVQRVASGQLKVAALPASVPAVVPGNQFASGLAALVIGVERDWPAFEARIAAWYDAVGQRSTGWFKRRVQRTVFAFGLVVAVVVNINPIVVASRLWDDEILRKAMVSAAEKALAADEAQRRAGTAGAPTPPAAPASELTPSAPVAAEAGGAAAKRSAAPDLAEPLEVFKVQLVAAIAAGTGSPLERVALDTAAARFLELREASTAWHAADEARRPAAGARVQNLLDELLRGVPPPPAWQALHDTHQRLRVATLAPAKAPAAPELAASRPSAAAPVLREQACKAGADAATLDLCQRLNELDRLREAGLPIGWSRTARPAVWNDGCGAVDKDGNTVHPDCQGWARLGSATWWGNTLLMPAGWLIVALACTLGSPFWFDALGKLVKLRASGGRPSSNSDGGAPGATPAPGMLARTPPASDSGGSAQAATDSAPVPMSDALNDPERALVRAEIERLQRAVGLSEPEVSGYFDGVTRRAIQAWQRQHTLSPADGELSAAQIHELLGLRPRGGDDDYLA